MSLQIDQPAMAQSNSDSTYNLVIHGKTYTINYQITGGRVNNITGAEENSTLLVGLSSTANGTLTIELPRNVIDSKKQGINVDDTYQVFSDSHNAPSFDEIKNNTQVRVLSISFHNGDKRLGIVGTQLAPANTPQITASAPNNTTAPSNATAAPANVTSAKAPANVTAPVINTTASAAKASLSNVAVPKTIKAPLTTKPQHHLCIFGSVAICLNIAPSITPQITTSAPATIKARANVSAPPSLEELAGQNVTKAPTNITSAKAKMAPAITPQITTSAPATIKAPRSPSLEELAGENVTLPANVTSAKVPSNATTPSTNATEHIKNEPIPQP